MSFGKLFVFEGPDGVGKSTLAHGLVNHLNSCGVDCEYFAFPGRQPGTLGYHIYQLHHDLAQFNIETISPASLQILHIASHVDAIERYILPTLKQGRSIVLDRYWWSTKVYGLVSEVNPVAIAAMLEIEFAQWGNLLPTATFLIGRSSPLREDIPLSTWHKLSSAYKELADGEKNSYPVFSVTNDESLEITLAEIVRALTQVEQRQQPTVSIPTQKKNLNDYTTDNEQLRLDLFGAEVNTNRSTTKSSIPTVLSRLSPARPTEVLDTYWYFAAERQNIFFRKMNQPSPPWTDDPILAYYKFTNAYRASDRVSQYLIKNVIYRGEQTIEEVFFRTILFKIFNRIETWKLLQEKFGTISYSEYSFEKYDDILTEALNKGVKIFSAAYIMPSRGHGYSYSRKHRNYLRLLERMLEDEVPQRLNEMKRMHHAFELLRSYPMMGDFLAYQYITDLNYSEIINFSEKDFVIAGPGAKNGVQKCFSSLGGLTSAEIIRLMMENQEEEFTRLGLDFQSLCGRPLQLIDCQNLFCEVDKYARVAHPEVKGVTDRTRIKQIYHSKSTPIEYWYPPKWGLNLLISSAEGEKK